MRTAVLASVLTLPLGASTQGSLALDAAVIAPAGGTASNGAFSLQGTLGQPVVDRSAGGQFVLRSGFWFTEPGQPLEDALFADGFE